MLTPSQQEALRRTSHTAIVANAGSGKTRVLVDQYLDILQKNQHLSPRDIVAITFSEQAAKDIKKKIREEILSRLQLENSDSTNRRLIEIYDGLPASIISTIHSFCAQLLRQYPTEAKVDSTFGMLTQPEDLLLREECIESTLYEAIERNYAAEKVSALLQFLKKYGRARVFIFISYLFSKWFAAEQLIEYFNSTPDSDIAEGWNAVIESYLQSNIVALFDVGYYNQLLNYIKSTKKREEAEKVIENWNSSHTTKDGLSAIISILTLFHNQSWDTLNGNLIHKEYKEDLLHSLPDSLRLFRSNKEIILSYSGDKDNSRPTQDFIRNTRILLSLFNDAHERYNEQKNYYSLLDFDDLLEKAYILLERPDIRVELINRYPFLLVDEFQDTDSLQYEIIKSLTSNFVSGNRLIIVGDPKQSIYGFRNADVSLFTRTTNAIRNATGNEKIELKESFRMLARPLAFINALFAHLFSMSSKDSSEVEYSELILGRNEDSSGSVEFLFQRDKKESENEDQIGAAVATEGDEEAVLIASKIAEITSPDSSYSISEAKALKVTSRAILYHDIGILLRSRTHLEKIESALRKANIPFLTYGGRGFYTCPEIIDITNYLTFLVNPADDIALAGVLRSSYFSIPDTDLFSLSTRAAHSSFSLWDRIKDKVSAKYELSNRVLHAYEMLQENIELAGKLTSSLLLEKIFSETLIFGILQTQPEGAQRIANLQKFSDLSLSFASSGFLGIYDFMERINLLAQREEEEALAESLTDSNAVHIMTIHGSKGLEFPVVFLPFLGRDISKGGARGRSITIDGELGISIKDPESDSQPIIASFIDMLAKKKTMEEEKRILYVGVTRARDHLFLSATINGIPKEMSYLGWIAKAFRTDFSTPFAVSKKIRRYSLQSQEVSDEMVSFEVPVISEIDRPESRIQLPPTNLPVSSISILTNTIEAVQGRTRYSPTQLLVFRQCPTKYHLRFNLGIPEDMRLSFEFPPPDNAEYLKGSLVGHLVHKVLQSVDEISSGGTINEDIFTENLRRALEELALDAPTYLPRYKERVLSHFQSFFISDFGKSVLLSKWFYTELPLRIELNGKQLLSGIIDRLYEDEQGFWHILDYKTDRNIEDVEKVERYKFQLRFYAYLVSRLFKIKETLYGHLFFTNFSVVENFEFTEHDLKTVATEMSYYVASILRDKKAVSLSVIERNRSHCPECAYYIAQRNLCLADQ